MRLRDVAAAAGLVAALVSPFPLIAAPADPPAAAPVSAAPQPRVVTIEIEGARRTRRETVLTLARVREGDPWREGLAEEARQELANAGIFYDISVTPEPADGGVRLRIALREKWSLIAFPLVTVKDGETTWGATAVESNLLGTGSKLIATLAVREGAPGGRLLYIDPHLGGPLWQLFGALAYLDERRAVWDADGETGTYRQRNGGGTAALGYRFGRRTSVSAGLHVMDFNFSEPEGDAAPPADAGERALVLMLRHEGTDRDEERRRGLGWDLRLQFGLRALGDEVGRAAADGTARWARTGDNGHTLDIRGYALWTDTVDYEDGPPPSGFLRGYDADRFRPDRLLGGTVEYQLPVARFREASFMIVPFADAALLRDEFRSFTPGDVQADAGLALAVYVRRVALPVLQLYAAYGFATGEVLPGFSLGVGF